MAFSHTTEVPPLPEPPFTTDTTHSIYAFIKEELEEAQALSDSPEANADPHFLLLGKPGVGKSTFAGKITGGKVRGISGPGNGTKSSNRGRWKNIKTEVVENALGATESEIYNNGKRCYVHDSVGLGDEDVDPEEMKREAKEVCEENDSQCCVFLCLSVDDRIKNTKIVFEVCNSLNKWEDVIFVITKCDLASQLAPNVDEHDVRRQWREAIKEKLIQMRVNEEIANTITTKQIVFSGYPELHSELLDAISNICKNGYEQGKLKYLSFGKALFISELVDGSVTTIAEPNENLDESMLSSGSHHSQCPSTPSSQFSHLSSLSSYPLSCHPANYQRSSSSNVARRRRHPHPRNTLGPDSAEPQTETAVVSNSDTSLKGILLRSAAAAGVCGLIGSFIGGVPGAIVGGCLGFGAIAILFLIGKIKKLMTS